MDGIGGVIPIVYAPKRKETKEKKKELISFEFIRYTNINCTEFKQRPKWSQDKENPFRLEIRRK